MTNRDEIGREILVRAIERGAGKTICPSEVARALEPENWRALMPEVREAAAILAASGVLVVTQRGAEVDLATVRGPVRLGLRRASG